MQLEPHHDLTIADNDWADCRLYEHNVAATGRKDWKPIAFWVRNIDGSVVGVANGYSWAGVAELKQMWVSEPCRGKGIARQLLDAFIAEARQREVKRIFVASHSFQAPGMYEKFGFRRIAEFAGWPDGHSYVVLCNEFGGE